MARLPRRHTGTPRSFSAGKTAARTILHGQGTSLRTTDKLSLRWLPLSSLIPDVGNYDHDDDEDDDEYDDD